MKKDGLLNTELSEQDQVLIIKIFINDGYGALIDNKDLIEKYGPTFLKTKMLKIFLSQLGLINILKKDLKIQLTL